MKNIYIETEKREECNGCGLCALNCPVNAITMKEDDEGFFYPVIDHTKCIGCNKCKNTCSNYNDSEFESTYYMLINKNQNTLLNSSSGGAFYLLVDYVLRKNGIVFGVEYDENLKVQHNAYSTYEDCKKFHGSKYVRSDLRNSYSEVKKELDKGKWVLFTGTPCQCNAIKTYLGKEYDRLILCDIICHANPSQKVFDKYVQYLENKRKDRVLNINFKSKKNGWKNPLPIVQYGNGNEIEEDDIFYTAFVSELFNRPSCSQCKFASEYRITDITIGDLWGHEKVVPEIKEYNNGISLILVNSKKGMKIFNEIKNEAQYKKVNKAEVVKYNHFNNVKMHDRRKDFFANFDKLEFDVNVKKNLKKSIWSRIISKLKHE